MAYTILRRKWKTRKATWILMPAELAGLVPMLVLFGIAQPDLYRTTLWEIGHYYKLNSDPRMILYAYANHEALPNVPFVWSETITNFNVAISVISLFVLLSRLILFIMKVWFPVIGLGVDLSLIALYVTSTYGQIGPDHADPRYPTNVAWYISRSCDLAKPWGAVKDCQMAKGSLAVTVYMLSLYVAHLGVDIWSMLPTENAEDLDDDDDDLPREARQEKQEWEMQPRTPGSHVPFTPRTQAFHSLDRKLPLRYS